MSVSRTTRERLAKELRHLEEVGLPAARRAIEDARTQGDTSQNPDFFIAAEAEGRLRDRHSRLLRLLREPPVDAAQGGAVTVGVVVDLDFGDGIETYTVGSIEEQFGAVQVITPESPVGRAIMGALPGQTCRLQSGATVVVRGIRPA